MPANPDNDTGFRQLPMPISDVCCKTWPTLAPPWHRPLWHACEAGLRHWRCCAHDLSMRKFWRRCNRTQLSSISSWPGCYEVSCLCQVLTCTHINSQTCPQSRYQGVGRVFRVVAALWRLMKTLMYGLMGNLQRQVSHCTYLLRIPVQQARKETTWIVAPRGVQYGSVVQVSEILLHWMPDIWSKYFLQVQQQNAHSNGMRTCVCIFMGGCRTGDCDLSLAQYLSCMGSFLCLLGLEMVWNDHKLGWLRRAII